MEFLHTALKNADIAELKKRVLEMERDDCSVSNHTNTIKSLRDQNINLLAQIETILAENLRLKQKYNVTN